MRRQEISRLRLQREFVRVLTTGDLSLVGGGRRDSQSEAGGGGPCAGEYSFTCTTGLVTQLAAG